MDREELNQAKVLAFAEKLRAAINSGTLECEMSVFRIEAVELGLSEEQLNDMIVKARHRSVNDNETRLFLQKFRLPIVLVLIIVVAIELFLPIGLGWKLVLILVTLALCLILLSVLIVARRKNCK